jgi:hypothetical protein
MGGSMTMGAPSTGAPVDIRQKVDADRGFLKRLELLIPGFHGYRVNEDLRESDSILRLQVANKVLGALNQMNDVRASMVQAGLFSSLNDLASSLAELQILEGTIRHAEQGYSGVAAPIRVQANDLERLYEYDYGFAQAADQIAQGVGPLKGAALGSDGAALNAAVAQLRSQVQTLQATFKARMQAIEGINVP